MRRTICCSAVSRPTRVARNRNAPVPFTVPPKTGAPGAFSTGIDSPVSIDSSTVDRPSIHTPSTGRRSPGRTSTMSSTMTSATGTVSSIPSRTMRASRGWRPTSRRIASEVRDLARASIKRPTSTSTMIATATS
jgi:hypothetical protein